MRDDWKISPLGKFIKQSKKKVKVEVGLEYPAIGVMMEGRGFVTRPPFVGGKTTYKHLTPIEPNQLVLRSITAWEAPIQVTTEEHSGFHVSGVFPVFDIDNSVLNPRFLSLLCRYEPFWESMRARTVGSVLRRKTLSASALMEIPINLPPLQEQARIVDLISSVDSYIYALEQRLESARKSRSAVLHELLSAGGDSWTKTTLGELINLFTGKLDVNASKPNGEYPFFTCAKEIYWINEHAFEGAAVLVAGNGDLNVKFYDGKFNAYQRTYVLFSKDSQRLVPRYLFLFMSNYINELRNSTQGSTIQYLKKNQFTDAKISLPSLPEQKRIVDLISSMDNGISATEKLISDTKQLRSGLLSDLLSGEHEIPQSYDKVMGAA